MDATVSVRSTADVGPNTIVIEFDSPDGFEAQPGQFVKLTGEVNDESYSRFYTLSSPDVTDTFEVTIGIDESEGGEFSVHLGTLEAGDELEMSGPFGSDYYEGESRVVVLAGGPGVGPAIGIGDRALADGNEAAIVYQDDAPAHEERLAELEARGATVYVVSDGIEDAVEATVSGESGEQVFIYGFASFIETAEAALEAIGADPSDAKVENFG
ncbi:FAD-dependent oxidoreductase [Natronocalculus amylovorans]|uniref:FAD-dependent oxidoreductase n=1 Tax=Natronocalculus amylovorans TaxID=2917812 RepID=A0AAE3FUD5_9EURY|nr:FAD-dependent oxidoreductase [Natronocalculus amylovorans]MCL9815386.1 FAD-dependent oxidoreductase [Natronocalculus amylovorans]NUE02100.1 FAD-dependent oxidoreductase [Halorubraceae archaeon YAN]